MNTSKLAKLGLVGLAYGGIMVMAAAEAPRNVEQAEAKEAAKQATRAVKALGRRDTTEAVVTAEQAVAMAPHSADYRLLLGQSYLQAGRFASAGQAFSDVLALDASNGKAALNLALVQIAQGDWQSARRTLEAHTAEIPTSDRGLALALAGDTRDGVALLTELARSPAATPKVRQNLALAYALAGQWQAARVVAAADMSPADVDARLQQWAAFAQPEKASDQVAGLLGVRPVADNGQPVGLALNAPAAPVAMAAAVPVEVPAPVAAAPTVRQIAFGPRHEVVQALPVMMIARATGPVKVAARVLPVRVAAVRSAPAPVRTVSASGDWYVQLGAYQNDRVAKDAWNRHRRFAAFAGHTPNGVMFKTATATYYRLSVGGFARADADRACRAYKARGGDCFVRGVAGDRVAAWTKPAATQLAMR